MSTAEVLGRFVNYHASNPREYNDLSDSGRGRSSGFNEYKKALNDHLKGERGTSLIPLLFETRVAGFNPGEVKLGLTPSCPMSLRQEIIAQHNYRSNENRRINELGPATTDSIRVTNLMAGKVGMALRLTYRIVRAVVRALFAVLTVPYALHQQHRYGIQGWAKEDLKRIGWEWIDVGATIASLFAGVVNTFHPNAINLNSLRDYYIDRTDRAILRNQEFAAAKKQYLQARSRTRAEEM